MRLRLGRKRRRHPDEEEAREWVQAEIDRLRSTAESDLIARLDTPDHVPFTSRTGRRLMGESIVFWDTGDPGPIGAIVDVCEPRPGVVTPIAQDSFIRYPDGSFD